MFKEFVVIKKEDLKTGEKTVKNFTLKKYEGETRRRILDHLYRLEDGRKLKDVSYSFDETLCMSLPNFSQETVNEISKYLYLTAYVVIRRKNKNENVIHLSLLKDTAIRYKNSLKDASITYKNKEYRNPNLFVKEVKLILA